MAQGKSLGFIYNENTPDAVALSKKLTEQFGKDYPTWVSAAADVEKQRAAMKDTRVAVVLGGDGTILRVSHQAAPEGVPMVGVNLGRVGFMTELRPEEVLERLPLYLTGNPRVEERMMIQVSISPRGASPTDTPKVLFGLNEVALGRTLVSRLVFVAVNVDGVHMATYGADAVIIATPSGSTGYALSAGGPVMHPQSRTLLIKPVAPQIALNAAVVLHENAIVRLTLGRNDQPSLSVDGFINMSLSPGDSLEVKKSPHLAKFLRMQPPTHFYTMLFERLGFGKPISPDERRIMADRSGS